MYLDITVIMKAMVDAMADALGFPQIKKNVRKLFFLILLGGT